MLLDSAPQNYANNGEKFTPVFTDLRSVSLVCHHICQKLGTFHQMDSTQQMGPKAPHCLSQAHLPEDAHVMRWWILWIYQYTYPNLKASCWRNCWQVRKLLSMENTKAYWSSGCSFSAWPVLSMYQHYFICFSHQPKKTGIVTVLLPFTNKLILGEVNSLATLCWCTKSH